MKKQLLNHVSVLSGEDHAALQPVLKALCVKAELMDTSYIAELRKYRKIVMYWRFSIAFFVGGAIFGVIRAYHFGSATLPAFLDSVTFIFLLPFLYFGYRMSFFRCPKCSKHFCTKNATVVKTASRECVHCGFSIEILPEVKSRPLGSHTDE